MTHLSIVTPWSGETHDLIADYFAAIQGASAEVVTIDNASAPATADALRQMTTHLCGIYMRNETNLGFAAANNQGYARATGDIIIFLNSDIAADPRWLRMVQADVKDGALYGPSLQQQLVAGRFLPYIEGWCIAATKKTWRRLFAPEDCTQGAEYIDRYGPWDEYAYPGPYWEDNDLCFRALQEDIALIQTAWPVQHKVARTAGPIWRHGASFAANERTFTDRVLQVLDGRAPAWTPVYQRYREWLAQPTDMQHHLPLLYSLARGNVLELGVRTGISTTALLAGVEAHGGRVWSIDIGDCSNLYAGHPQWAFCQGNSLDSLTYKALAEHVKAAVELLLLDTIHTWEHIDAELRLWAPCVAPGGTICVHDPETFPGVRRAVSEFCAARGWNVTFVLPCHGMAVIEVPR